MRIVKVLLVGAALFTAAIVHAEILTATFTGLADGYQNFGPSDPGVHFHDDVATGTLTFDPDQFSFVNGAYRGPGVSLTFKLRGQTETWGGIGFDPARETYGGFFAGGNAERQGVTLQAANCPCFAPATFNIAGTPGAFGPDELTPDSFHPGKVFLEESFAEFGDRMLGAHIRFTSMTMTQGTTSVVSSVPEPAVTASLLAGMTLLCAAAQRSRRRQLRNCR